jgi:hypothetical protein
MCKKFYFVSILSSVIVSTLYQLCLIFFFVFFHVNKDFAVFFFFFRCGLYFPQIGCMKLFVLMFSLMLTKLFWQNRTVSLSVMHYQLIAPKVNSMSLRCIRSLTVFWKVMYISQILLIIYIYIYIYTADGRSLLLFKATPSQYGCFYLCFSVMPWESVTAAYQLILQNSCSYLQKTVTHDGSVICMSILSDYIW